MDTDASLIAREVLYTYRCCEQIFGFQPTITPDELAHDFERMSAVGRPLRPGEEGIVSLFRPKTAALLADRVWVQYPHEHPRLDFTFGLRSPVAIRLMALHAFMKSSEFSPLGAKAPTAEVQEAHPIGELSSKTNELVSLTERDLVDDYCRQSGARLTPLYVSSESRDNDYKPGNYAVITSVIENAAIVSEENLSWDAVIDFRQDPNARASYRAFIHWLDKEMIGKSGTFIVDEVGVRMEAYKRALSKHGIQTVIGALERALDAKALVGSATTALTLESIAHLPLVSILSGAGLLIGNAAIHVATRLIERADIVASNKEIAFVHQVGQKFGA